MKNIFNDKDKNELLLRIEKLTPDSKALWGKMTVAQMLAHCTFATKIPTGEISTRRLSFPFSLIGSVMKPYVLSEKPFMKNSPTAAEIKIEDERDFPIEKTNFINAIKKLSDGGESNVKASHHPFLGKMAPAEWGRINYKHADHHLSQFGV